MDNRWLLFVKVDVLIGVLYIEVGGRPYSKSQSVVDDKMEIHIISKLVVA